MRKVATSEASLFGLIGHFRDEVKELVQREIQLAKTEMSEKFARFGRNAAVLAGGGLAAFAGVIILLASLSSLLSFAFESAGMQRSLAFFLGAFIIAGSVILTGFLLVKKALKVFSHESLAPEKTLETLKKLTPGTVEEEIETVPAAPEPKASSDEIEQEVDVTRREAGATAEEITHRLTPRHMGHVVLHKIKTHPVVSVLIGAGTGAASFFLIRWRMRQARA